MLTVIRRLFKITIFLSVVAAGIALCSILISTGTNYGMAGFFPFVFLAAPLAVLATLSAIAGGILYTVHRLKGGEPLSPTVAISVYVFFAIGVVLAAMTLFSLFQEGTLRREVDNRFIEQNPPGVRDVSTKAAAGMFRVVIINEIYDIDALGPEFDTLESAQRYIDESTQPSPGFEPLKGRTYSVYDDAGNLLYSAKAN